MSLSPTERVRAAYDAIAADYARRNAAMPPELAEAANRLLEMTGRKIMLLDVGCGAGRDMAWIEAQGIKVVGVDFSAGMLREARRRTRGSLFQMDMRRLAFDDESFGAVWCTALLLHLPKRDAPGALAEMRRVLRTGGALFLGVQEGEGETWESAPYGNVERLFARYAPDEVEAMLHDTGFTVRGRGRNAAGSRHWISFLATTGARG